MAEDPFHLPQLVAELMRGYDQPWGVAGGWAVDLFLGRVTREHGDIEIAVLRRGQRELRAHLRGWEFEVVSHATHRREPWREGAWIFPPDHEIHARRVGGDLHELEILMNEASADVWRFRRNPKVTRPLAAVFPRSEAGIPFLAPEIVLLYKAKRPNENDERDFTNACERLGGESRQWLRKALEVCHPRHLWIARLASRPATS